MKAAQQEVRVDLRAGQPARVHWNGRPYAVGAVHDQWRYGGRWWLNEAPRDCYLLDLGAVTAELHREDGPAGRWWLARVVD